MHKLILEICEELEGIAAQMAILNNTPQRLVEAHGWNTPSVSFKQYADLPKSMATDLRASEIDQLPQQMEPELNDLLGSLKALKAHTVPNFPSNPPAGAGAYTDTLTFVSAVLAPLMAWRPVKPGYLPKALANRLIRIDGEIDALMPDYDRLQEKVAGIREASELADGLPTTLAELRTAQDEVKQSSTRASELIGQISEARDRVATTLQEIEASAVEANGYAKRAADAHQITTTIGLAAAFDERAKKLNLSLQLWVASLVIALAVLSGVGYYRLNAIKEALAVQSVDASRIWLQVLLSILSVGAPIWFAWIATKQIGQRFRLAEDYGFKASVAKAYEGYRRQAVQIDPNFEKALFASALARLDEAPLRLMETTTHGSPLHELANSSLAQAIISRVNGLRKADDQQGEPERSSPT